METVFNQATETLEDLGRNGMHLIQPRDHFRYGTDSVLLADFAAAKAFRRAIDLGTGCGVIALLLSARRANAQVDCVEIQPWAAKMAQRNIALNGLESRMRVYAGDMATAATHFGYEKYDLIVSNPPYYAAAASLHSPYAEVETARQDDNCTPAILCKAAFSLCKTGGRFSLVYPAARLPAILQAMQEHRFAPKRIRCIQDTPTRAPKLLLIEGVKQGGEGLLFCPPLILHNEDGSETDEYRRIYGF